VGRLSEKPPCNAAELAVPLGETQTFEYDAQVRGALGMGGGRTGLDEDGHAEPVSLGTLGHRGDVIGEWKVVLTKPQVERLEDAKDFLQWIDMKRLGSDPNDQ